MRYRLCVDLVQRKRMRFLSNASAFALIALIAVAVSATRVSIRNDMPRLDTTGVIMDAHDCSIRQLPNGTYVMHAIEYGLCVAPTGQGCDSTPDHCGFRGTHNVTVWTSPNLTSGSWTRAGYAFPLTARPAGLIFRPDAIFNPNTGLWVLYYNDAGNGNVYISSTSPSPFGPFTGFAKTNVTDSTWTGGDFHLFSDTDGTGYIIWTGMSSKAGDDHKIRISKLTRDYLGVTTDAPYMFNDNSPTTTFNEAPSIFLRNGVWYALFGHCCCFCYQGSGLFVHTAPTPMGPWTAASAPYDISCEAPPPPPPPTPANPFCAGESDSLARASATSRTRSLDTRPVQAAPSSPHTRALYCSQAGVQQRHHRPRLRERRHRRDYERSLWHPDGGVPELRGQPSLR